MSQPRRNLWNLKFQLDHRDDTPYRILREQAEFFHELSGHILRAKISHGYSDESGQISYRKDLIIVKSHYNYHGFVEVLSVSYGQNFYPVSLTDKIRGKVTDCADPNAFVNVLGETLSSRELQAAIDVFVAHMHDHENS